MKEEKKNEIQLSRSVDPDEMLQRIQTQLADLSREPFENELARFLRFAPSDEALQAHANKSPDRWCQAVTMLGKLSGVTDKEYVPLKFDFFTEIENMTPAERRKLYERETARRKQELEEEEQNSTTLELQLIEAKDGTEIS